MYLRLRSDENEVLCVKSKYTFMFFYYFLTESFTILNIWRFYQKNYRSKSAGKDSCHKYEILYKKIIIITDKY